ncbi:hypothetical protein PVAP13_1KG111892 [Panicum virgatum]|uniref:Uncharacterized protein n=1 Tax=Panicum virgatum TaxID=38727 RepID=A0A8T0Y3F0_PANVG|nr:hypothetical protein PVAP13_1KG111892 [Panicum virgatum]
MPPSVGPACTEKKSPNQLTAGDGSRGRSGRPPKSVSRSRALAGGRRRVAGAAAGGPRLAVGPPPLREAAPGHRPAAAGRRSTGALLMAFLLGSAAVVAGTVVALLLFPMRSLGPPHRGRRQLRRRLRSSRGFSVGAGSGASSR